MNGLKRKEKEIGLVDLDKAEEEMTAEHVEKQIQKDSHMHMAIALFLASTLGMVLVSRLLLNMPFVMIGILIIIEAVLAKLLNDSVLWLHLIIMLVQAAFGFAFHKGFFLIAAAVYYFLMLIVLKLLELE